MPKMRFVTPLLLGLSGIALSVPYAHAQIGIGISIGVAPPILPVYVQPPLPSPGYIWAPGYWAWSDADADYYWVPGTWVLPPEPGLLWTPGYWGYGDNGGYDWHEGYWGPEVGFYGGVNYGYGYGGRGYEGGYWQHGAFYYNRNVNNFGGTHITNVYERSVTNVTNNHISYNGGHGGIALRPSAQEQAYQGQHHYSPTSNQMRQKQMASSNKALFSKQNHGHPPIAATPRPADFSHAVPARNAPAAMMGHGQAMAPQHEQAHAPGMMAPQHSSPMMAPAGGMHEQQPNHPQSMTHEAAPAMSHAQPMQEAPRPMAPQHEQMAPRPEQPQHTQMAPRPEPQHEQMAPRPEGGGGGGHGAPQGHEQHKPN